MANEILNDAVDNTISSFQQKALEKKMEAKRKAAELKQKVEDAKKKADEAKKKAKMLKAALKGFKVPILPKIPKFKMKDLKPPANVKKIMLLSAIAKFKTLNNFKLPTKAQKKTLLDQSIKEFSQASKSDAAIEAETVTTASLAQNITPVTNTAIVSVYKDLFKGVGKMLEIKGLEEITYKPVYTTLTLDSEFTPIDLNYGDTGGGSGGGGGTYTATAVYFDKGTYKIGVQDTSNADIDTVYNKYNSFVKRPFTGTPAYQLEWPSNPIIKNNNSKGKVKIRVSVELTNSAGEQLIYSESDSVEESDPMWANNHRGFFVIPAGLYYVKIKLISYESNLSREEATQLSTIDAQLWIQSSAGITDLLKKRLAPIPALEINYAERSFSTSMLDSLSGNKLFKININNYP